VFAIDTTYFVDESRTTANLRWLYYALSSLGLDGLSEDVGVPGLSREKAYEQRLLYPPPATQQAIADYLDRETARIDALIAAKWRMVELLFKRYWSWVGRQIDQCAPTYLPLRRFLTRITDGPFGSALTSNDYSSGGARVVRLGNIGSGFFRDDDAAYISTEYFQSLSRHRVSSGDLLIAGLGDANNAVGRACVAPELGPAIVKADCYCASVNVNRASADFLALYLSSPLGAKNVAVAARGTTRSRTNLDIALEVEVPLLPLAVQDEITLAATALRERGRELSQRLQLQLGLLEERRRSLITAAITGQLDIPEAA
jgi:type I restriction enzyme S subunit